LSIFNIQFSFLSHPETLQKVCSPGGEADAGFPPSPYGLVWLLFTSLVPVVGAVVLPTSGLWSFWSSRLDPVEVVVSPSCLGLWSLVICFVFVFLLQNISFETSKGE
jgi:hypothetical protein